MPKSITEQIEDLQNENLRLKEFEKLFEKAVRNEFGIGSKTIKKILKKDTENASEFEREICAFFGLESEDDKTTFLAIMCSDSSLRFFNAKRSHDS